MWRREVGEVCTRARKRGKSTPVYQWRQQQRHRFRKLVLHPPDVLFPRLLQGGRRRREHQWGEKNIPYGRVVVVGIGSCGKRRRWWGLILSHPHHHFFLFLLLRLLFFQCRPGHDGRDHRHPHRRTTPIRTPRVLPVGVDACRPLPFTPRQGEWGPPSLPLLPTSSFLLEASSSLAMRMGQRPRHPRRHRRGDEGMARRRRWRGKGKGRQSSATRLPVTRDGNGKRWKRE